MSTDTAAAGLVEALEKKATRASISHTLYLDHHAGTESKRLRDEIRAEKVRSGADLASGVPALQAQLDQLQQQLRDSALTVTLTQLTDAGWDQVVTRNPSMDPNLLWDDATFVPDLLAACITDVSGVYDAESLTVDEVKALFGRVNPQQKTDLYQSALRLHLEAPRPFTVPGGGETTDTGSNLSTASS